jgi:hypothetical protein
MAHCYAGQVEGTGVDHLPAASVYMDHAYAASPLGDAVAPCGGPDECIGHLRGLVLMHNTCRSQLQEDVGVGVLEGMQLLSVNERGGRLTHT